MPGGKVRGTMGMDRIWCEVRTEVRVFGSRETENRRGRRRRSSEKD